MFNCCPSLALITSEKIIPLNDLLIRENGGVGADGSRPLTQGEKFVCEKQPGINQLHPGLLPFHYKPLLRRTHYVYS